MDIDFCSLTVFSVCMWQLVKQNMLVWEKNIEIVFNQFGDPQYWRVVLHSDSYNWKNQLIYKIKKINSGLYILVILNFTDRDKKKFSQDYGEDVTEKRNLACDTEKRLV